MVGMQQVLSRGMQHVASTLQNIIVVMTKVAMEKHALISHRANLEVKINIYQNVLT